MPTVSDCREDSFHIPSLSAPGLLSADTQTLRIGLSSKSKRKKNLRTLYNGRMERQLGLLHGDT